MTDSVLKLNAEIIGEPAKSYRRIVEQGGPEELMEIFQAAFGVGVTAFAWSQHTPSWNDGDACVFGVQCEGTFSRSEHITAHDIESAEGYLECAYVDDNGALVDEDGEPSVWETVDQCFYTLEGGYDDCERRPTDTPIVKAAQELTNVINSGRFDNVLVENFGDPATVVATPGKFYIEYFEGY